MVHIVHILTIQCLRGIKEKFMFCKNCGNQLDDDALFCTKCGSKVENIVDSNDKCDSVENEQTDSTTDLPTEEPTENIEEENVDVQPPEPGAEIKQKLIENGLETYIPIFEEQHLLDEDVLSMMTPEDYIQIGVTIIGDRKKMQLLFDKAYQNIRDKTSEQKKNEKSNVSTGEKNNAEHLMNDPKIKAEAELLYKMYGEQAYEHYLEKKSKELSKTQSEEFVDIIKNGKAYCYKASEPDKLLCRKCHAEVSDESYLCWNCNNNLVSHN